MKSITAFMLLITSSVCNAFAFTLLPTAHKVSDVLSIIPPSWDRRRWRTSVIMMGQRGKRIKKEIKKEKKEEVPPRINTPYGPIRNSRPLTPCDTCLGRGIVRCNVCDGRAVTQATGHRKRNALNVNRVVGSRWTSVEIREGWRQFECTELSGSRKKKVSSARREESIFIYIHTIIYHTPLVT